MNWNVALKGITALPTGASVQVYATNQDPAITAGNDCPVEGTPSGRHVGTVGSPISTSTVSVTGQVFATKEFVTAAQVTCSDNQQIWVCVQAFDAAGATGNKVGSAVGGPLKVKVSKPLTQTGVSAAGGDRSLHVSWTDPNSPPTSKYQIVAASILDPTFVSSMFVQDPRDMVVHRMNVTSTSDNRLGDLVNDVVYALVAYAFDEADNVSDPSMIVTGTPSEVNDFWDAYSAAGGREQGGCSSGPAGALGLLVAAASLIAARSFGRRK